MAKLIAHVHIDGRRFRPGDEVPDELAKLAPNPKLWDADAPEPSPEGAPEAYDGMTVENLKAEIDLRNSRRDDEHQIKPGGTLKADLIAALQADDQH